MKISRQEVLMLFLILTENPFDQYSGKSDTLLFVKKLFNGETEKPENGYLISRVHAQFADFSNCIISNLPKATALLYTLSFNTYYGTLSK